MHDRAGFFWKNSLWAKMGINGQKLPKNGVVITGKIFKATHMVNIKLGFKD